MTTQAAVDPPKRRGKITDDERAGIVDLIASGKHSCREIAELSGRDKASVSRIAAAEGLDFERSQTRAATAARQADNQARLAAFAENLLGDIERLREQLWEPCTVYAFGGRDNDFNSREISEPDFAAKRNIMASLGIATDKIIAIRRAEAGPGEAAGLIVDLVRHIRDDL